MGVFGKINRFLREQGLIGEGMAATRKLEGGHDVFTKVIAASFSLFFLYTTFFGLISQESHIGFYVLGTFVLSLMLFKGRQKSPDHRFSLFDGLFILGLILVIVYYIIEFPTLADRIGPEKIEFCRKTFQVFEKLDLIRECNNPKTVSNLHLVPKYEGLRDLTKASTYLAQVRGEKNHSFRIVQDLRRINAHTKNIRKSHPVLPESIFSRMQGKIVSSIDANQAYWHLVIDPLSRPYTCFYLAKKIYQYNRMAQGLSHAPACWDHAMSIIFSEETMNRVKKEIGP